LNYGHTFGHALETLTNFEIPHGLAVAWGLDLANWISWKSGIMNKYYFNRINKVIKQYFIFPTLSKVNSQKLFNHMKHDKKVENNKISLILLEKPGILKIVPKKIGKTLFSVVDDYIEAFNISNNK